MSRADLLPAAAAAAPAPALDPVAMLLADKRSPATKRAYAGDLKDFFGAAPGPGVVRAFVSLPAPEIALRLTTYKAGLMQRGAAEATVNRRLSAVRSLLKFCHRLGYAQTDGRNLVESEKAQTYRDTRGVDLATMRRLIQLPGKKNLAGLRDTALLRLLCENALRRAEVCALDVADWREGERRLMVLGKGKGTQKAPITASRPLAGALSAYLSKAGHRDGALFRNLDHRPEHHAGRLTPNGLYELVQGYGKQLGVPQLSPHRLRHSAITAALDATNGDVRRVQKLSRHSDIRTLTIYDDNRHDHQGDVSESLAALLGA